jgi:hypothetical protein
MALTRAELPVLFTQGFNPLVKIEIVSPLSTGISADGEIGAVDFPDWTPDLYPENFLFNFPKIFMESLNKNMPSGICINNADIYYIPVGIKKHSLSSLLWGFGYQRQVSEHISEIDYITAIDEKKYRQARLENDISSVFYLKRSSVLAKDITGSSERASYFDVYKQIYG